MPTTTHTGTGLTTQDRSTTRQHHTHTGTGLTTQDRSTTHTGTSLTRTVLPHANHHTHRHQPYHPGPFYHTPTTTHTHWHRPYHPGPFYHTPTTTHTGTGLTTQDRSTTHQHHTLALALPPRTVLPHAKTTHTHWHRHYHPGPFYHTPTTTHTGTGLTTQDRSTTHQPPHTLARALPPRTALPHANHHTHWHGPHQDRSTTRQPPHTLALASPGPF